MVNVVVEDKAGVILVDNRWHVEKSIFSIEYVSARIFVKFLTQLMYFSFSENCILVICNLKLLGVL